MSAGDAFGPLRVADRDVFISTSDTELDAVMRWSFGDLAATDSSHRPPVARQHVFHVARHPQPWPRWSIRRDGEICDLTLEEDYVLFQLQWELNRVVLEASTSSIHAAAVDLDGSAIVLCGSSMSGKTTLAGHLARTSGRYMSDEIVTLTADGLAAPYPRPLGIRPNGPLSGAFRRPNTLSDRFDRYEMLVPASALGARLAATDPIPVSLITFPTYDPDGADGAQAIGKSEALERLCAQSPGLASGGRATFLELADLVRRVPSYVVMVRDLDHAAAVILELPRAEVGAA
jgi:hypothetical protein